MKIRKLFAPYFYIATIFFPGSLVGADPELTNAQAWLDLDKILKKVDSSLFSVKKNLIDLLWTEETGRPPFVVRKCKLRAARVCNTIVGLVRKEIDQDHIILLIFIF